MDQQTTTTTKLRRSARLLNKKGTKMSIHARDLFSKDWFQQRNYLRRKSKQNNNNNNNNNNINMKPFYPEISRSKRILKCIHHDPNVFIIPNFLTEKEINHLIKISHTNSVKFQASYTQATASDQIFSAERTSTFIFLEKFMDRLTFNIETRASDIISMPVNNVENLQIVRYTDGQEFKLHHDAGTLINETKKKTSTSSLWSLTSNNSNSINSQHSNSIHSNISYSNNVKCNTNNNNNNTNNTNNNNNDVQQIVDLTVSDDEMSADPSDDDDDVVIIKDNINDNNIQKQQTNSILPIDDNDDKDDDDDDIMIGNDNDDLPDLEYIADLEYKEKHAEYTIEMVAPYRVCSYFVYLTTLPPGCGGETYFPKIDLHVRPERGKAILWCNVDVNDTQKANPMLIHKALPVKGNYEKIGMNIWINDTSVNKPY